MQDIVDVILDEYRRIEALFVEPIWQLTSVKIALLVQALRDAISLAALHIDQERDEASKRLGEIFELSDSDVTRDLGRVVSRLVGLHGRLKSYAAIPYYVRDVQIMELPEFIKELDRLGVEALRKFRQISERRIAIAFVDLMPPSLNPRESLGMELTSVQVFGWLHFIFCTTKNQHKTSGDTGLYPARQRWFTLRALSRYASQQGSLLAMLSTSMPFFDHYFVFFQ